MPKVSVIVPVYRVEKYIERCSRSLFEQTLDNIEFIFIDDCTPDHSMEILGKIIEIYRTCLTEKNYTVKTLRMPTNSGQAAVRRHGIKLATGDYVIHCDSDDWVDTKLYESLYSSAIKNDCELSICDICSHDGGLPLNLIVGCKSTIKHEFISSLLYQNTPWSLCNKMFKRELYQLYVIEYPKDNMGEDMAINMQMILGVKKMVYITDALYYYYSNPNSISKTVTVDATIKKFHQYLNNFNIIKRFYSSQGLIEKYRKEFIWLEYSVKSILNHPDKKCKTLWKQTFKRVEFKVLLLNNITWTRKRIAIKSIIKHII